MTESRCIIVVSDRFAGFANNDRVVTWSRFQTIIESGEEIAAENIVVGQGINGEQLLYLNDRLCSADRIPFTLTDRVDQSLVHKASPKNVLISGIAKESETAYKARLVIDENCAEMSDHITGQHIQGSILIEAARQMMMAVVEQHVLDQSDRGLYAYTLNTLNIKYLGFVFPVEVDVSLIIQDIREEKLGVTSFKLRVQFSQFDCPVCEVYCESFGYPKKLLEKMESRSAKAAVMKAVEKKLLGLVYE